ncbi:hypothetical protein PG996_011271 [Apiospora saccharicola]|uniref:Uncharacterized protein n=1 Tax=Apiospora saccharicola TaxID=335842 RepID=A0ABR1UHI6_9PEZI
MGRGSYDTTGSPKPAPPKPNAITTIISSANDGDENITNSISRFAPLVNHSRIDPPVTEGGFLSDLGRGGYDITNSPKPAPRPPRGGSGTPKPPHQPRPDQPPRN